LSPRKAIAIRTVPFRHINALTDVKTGEIFLSPRIEAGNPVIADEIAHVLSGSPLHDQPWREMCQALGGQPEPDHLDRFRRRLGIAAHLGGNIGNITGVQQMLTDYTLLQQYRRFSQRILGTEGHWEVLGDRKIRLYPTPKGAMPVLVLYIPPITQINSPLFRQLVNDMIVAEAKIVLGNSRSKFSSIPSPDGGSITLNGAEMVQQGEEAKEAIIEKANLMAEPLGVFRY
jgi:hypothetical protein